MGISSKKTLVSEMAPGQLFQFYRFETNSSICWQKKGTKTISRINRETKEIIATYYFTRTDYGYCVIEGLKGNRK